ncbi:MAG: hypothetical protein LBR61_12175, partial [Synergistaceae bacterium]|nr:hypothetical protein [Synergistaceae bacterium]
TDRVYLDPAFSPKQAANRYIGWIGDEIERGCDLYKLIYKDQSIGFFTFKDLGEGVYFPFLSGMYSGFKQGGLGLGTAYYPVIETKKRDGKQTSSYISSNNVSTVKNHVFLKYYFDDINYVYVKHN